MSVANEKSVQAADAAGTNVDAGGSGFEIRWGGWRLYLWWLMVVAIFLLSAALLAGPIIVWAQCSARHGVLWGIVSGSVCALVTWPALFAFVVPGGWPREEKPADAESPPQTMRTDGPSRPPAAQK